MFVSMFRTSLKARLVLLVLLAVTPLLSLIAYNGWEDRQEAVESATKEVLALTSSMVVVQAQQTTAARQLLDTLALTPELRSGDPTRVQPLLARILANNPSYTNLLAARPDGEVYASALGSSGFNSSDRRHFRDAVAQGAFAPGEYIVSRSTNRPGFPFAAPVFDEERRLHCVLLLTLDLDQYRQIFDTSGLPEGSIMGMADHQGIRLFVHPRKEGTPPVGLPIMAENFALAATADPAEMYPLHSSDGVDRLYNMQAVRLAPGQEPYMYMFVGVPKDLVLGKAVAVTRRSLLLAGLVLCLTLAAARWLSTVMIARPVAELQDVADNIRQGRLDARSALSRSHDEFGQLASSLDAMADELERHAHAESASKTALLASENQLRIVADYTFNWEYWRAPDGSIVWMSPACLEITGYPPQAFQDDPTLIKRLIHPDDRPLYDAHAGEVDWGVAPPTHVYEFRILHKEGRVVWILHHCAAIFDGNGENLGRRISNSDITARKLAEEELRLGVRIFDDSIQGVVVTGVDGRVQRVNPSFSSITGYTAREIIGLTPRVLKSGRHPASFYKEMWQALLHQGSWSGEIWNRRKSGEIYPEWLSITSLRDPKGKITHFVAIFHDITEVKRHQQALQHQAEHDALTGLPNRQLFNDRLGMAIQRSKRNRGHLAVLFIDLDHFKNVNDSLGHAVGDMLLLELAKRIAEAMREQDTVARLGGDEFIVLVNDIEHPEDAAHTAQRILALLNEPFLLGELEFFATASLGIAIYPEDGRLAGELVKNADLDMYKAKSLGRNSFQFFDAAMEAKATARLALEARLQKAVRVGEFEVFYQPLMGLADGRILGAEALVRWRREGVLVSPCEFIPVAEETGLIIPLGEWVLNTACAQTVRFRERCLPGMFVAVNFSSRQFDNNRLTGIVERALEDSSLPASALHVEITESVLLSNMNSVVRQLEELKRMGVSCLLDDFGTGYSSLSYLKRLPIEGLKIDRSFVTDIETNAESVAIASAIVSLAKAMGLKLVAEGVENPRQLAILNELGVDCMQGYLLARPMCAKDFETFLAQYRPGPPACDGG